MTRNGAQKRQGSSCSFGTSFCRPESGIQLGNSPRSGTPDTCGALPRGDRSRNGAHDHQAHHVRALLLFGDHIEIVAAGRQPGAASRSALRRQSHRACTPLRKIPICWSGPCMTSTAGRRGRPRRGLRFGRAGDRGRAGPWHADDRGGRVLAGGEHCTAERPAGRLQVRIRHGNLFAPVRGQSFDLILANPPCVPAPDTGHVPRGAARSWDAGRERTVRPRLDLSGNPALLRPGGVLLVVHSALSCPDRTLGHLRGQG